MQSKEFIIWLKGFITACNDYAPTPKQWDIIKEELEKVGDDKFVETPGMFQVHPEPPYPGVPIGPGWGIPNTTPTPIQPYIDPFNPYKITCNITGSGTTFTPGFVVTTNPNTSFTQMYPSGSSWSYTNSSQPFSTQDDDSLEPKK